MTVDLSYLDGRWRRQFDGMRLLIRMKDTVRDSDKVDVRFLRLRLEEEGP